jgi:hypothetical protein
MDVACCDCGTTGAEGTFQGCAFCSVAGATPGWSAAPLALGFQPCGVGVRARARLDSVQDLMGLVGLCPSRNRIGKRY